MCKCIFDVLYRSSKMQDNPSLPFLQGVVTKKAYCKITKTGLWYQQADLSLIPTEKEYLKAHVLRVNPFGYCQTLIPLRRRAIASLEAKPFSSTENAAERNVRGNKYIFQMMNGTLI